jgi:hypothetical protein
MGKSKGKCMIEKEFKRINNVVGDYKVHPKFS